MQLLRYFRTYGAADHGLFASTYNLRGWTYTDRSCLPPVIKDPEGKKVSKEDCRALLCPPPKKEQ